MAIIANGDPYVHSRIYNFHRTMSGSDLDPSTQGREEFSQRIEHLKKMKDVLEQEANSFLGGKTWQEFSQDILNNPNTFRGIAMEILRRKDMLEVFSYGSKGYSKKDLQKILNKKRDSIGKELIDSIQADYFSASELDQIIESFLGKKQIINLTLSQQRSIVEDLFTDSKKAELKVNEIMRKKLTSDKGKIKDIILTNLKKEMKATQRKDNWSQAFKYFRQEFLTIVGQRNITYKDDFTPEDYLQEVEKALKVHYKTKISTVQKASGSLGEEWLSVIVNMDSKNYGFQVVGDLTEEGLMSDKILSEGLTKMKTHHGASKFSQTDLILTNLSTGKRVRVQAKNAIKILNEILPSLEDTEAGIPQIIRIQDTTSLMDLVNKLMSSQTCHLTEQDVDNLKYLLANEVWFHKFGSIGDEKGRQKTDVNGGLQHAMNMVNQIFSKEISNFIGITLSDGLETVTTGSNIFYIFANTVIVPTYLLLEGLIEQFEFARDSLFSIRTTLSTTGIKFGKVNQKTFYEGKQETARQHGTHLIPNKRYEDSWLVEYGSSVGGNIVNSLKIERINLNVDLKTLLTSVYNFVP